MSGGERDPYVETVAAFAQSGDARAAKHLKQLQGKAGAGRRRLNVDDEVQALRDLIDAGVKQHVAIARVGARQNADHSRRQLWRDRLRELRKLQPNTFTAPQNEG